MCLGCGREGAMQASCPPCMMAGPYVVGKSDAGQLPAMYDDRNLAVGLGDASSLHQLEEIREPSVPSIVSVENHADHEHRLTHEHAARN